MVKTATGWLGISKKLRFDLTISFFFKVSGLKLVAFAISYASPDSWLDKLKIQGFFFLKGRYKRTSNDAILPHFDFSLQ